MEHDRGAVGRFTSAITGEQRVLAGFLVVVPLALIAALLGWPPMAQFVLSVAAVIPLAGFIGAATEALAEKLGARVGGLFNATFGNAPDLLVGVFGVQRGLIPLVKATLIGAIISNSALIMGCCFLVGGLLHGRPTFRRDEAGHHSVLMMLTLAALLFPSVPSITGCAANLCAPGRASIVHVSVAIAVVLLLAYLAYVAFGVLGFTGPIRKTKAAANGAPRMALEPGSLGWPLWVSIAVLATATIALIPITDILTGSVVPVTAQIGWSQVFVGIVVVANAGNVAEGYAALRFAATMRAAPNPETGESSGLDLALGIASASSIQIATLIAPVIVIYSLFGHTMSLVFSPVELAILALLVFIFTQICNDGESNWLEGVQLLALYAMAAIVFYTLPISAFQ